MPIKINLYEELDMKKILLISSVTAAMLFFAACGDSSSGGNTGSSSVSSTSSETSSSSSSILPSERKYADLIGSEYDLATFNVPLSKVSFANGYELDTTFSMGSGAFHDATDAENIVYFVSDRGPVITCEESESITGTKICDSGEIFVLNDFTPSIIKGEITGSKIKILDIIDLKDTNANPVTGISPELSNYTLAAYNQDGSGITKNIDGINPSAIVKTADGFFIAEEYGPSILKVDLDGNIIDRLVPENMVDEYQGSGYNIMDVLPDIIKNRAENRGITGLSINPESTKLFYMLESPLDNPKYSESRNVRLAEYNINQEVSTQYWYKLDSKSTSISEIVAIDNNQLLVAEKSDTETIVYKVDLLFATPLYDEFFDINTKPSFESIKGDTYKNEASILPDGRPEMKILEKTEIFKTSSDTNIAKAIDGLANLGDGNFILINNTDSTNSEDTIISSVALSVE